jgi:hypothetical protein
MERQMCIALNLAELLKAAVEAQAQVKHPTIAASIHVSR